MGGRGIVVGRIFVCISPLWPNPVRRWEWCVDTNDAAFHRSLLALYEILSRSLYASSTQSDFHVDILSIIFFRPASGWDYNAFVHMYSQIRDL